MKSISDPDRKKVYIVHPTRERTEIAWTGRAIIGDGRLRISLVDTPSVNRPIHRQLTGNNWSFKFENGRFVVTEQELGNARLPHERQILENLLNLVNTSIQRGHIKIATEKPTEISFLTWKDNPAMLELYDLIEKKISRV
ncbi:MAG: hypothetical protein NUV67_04940 [archaeon]|nr:hypothetical protein [archaeon]